MFNITFSRNPDSKPSSEPVITRNTPLNLARAQLDAWQRDKTFEFLNDAANLVKRYEAGGLDKKKMIEVLDALAKGLSKVAG